MKSIGSFSAILFLFILVWTLMGMELFAYKAITDKATNELISLEKAQELVSAGLESRLEYPRLHFNDMFSASITIYSLIIGEDWHQIMFTLVRAMRVNDQVTWLPKIYCVVGIVIGNFTLLALFTGTLL